jgi:flavin-dependent dehydrogenase
MSEMWDAIIIGGGPAGSTTAIKMSQLGRKVLVLEKEKFPRFHVGESLLPYNRRIFDELGLWSKLQEASFMIKRGAQFWLGDGTKKVRVTFAQGIFTEFPEAFQVERSRFDKILLDHASECGAEVREESTVLSHEVLGDRTRVKYRRTDGTEETVEGKFIVDASGLGNMTANASGQRSYYEEHKKVAIYGHFDNAIMPTGDQLGDILIIRRRNSWCWMIPISPTRTSVGLVLDRADFQEMKLSPEEAFAQAMDNTPEMNRRLSPASKATPMHVARDFSYRNASLASPRVMRVGDSAGFIDPIFSSGVFLAMQSGRDAAEVIHAALDKDQAMTSAMKRYEKNTRRRISIYWEFIENYYTHAFTELFFQPQPGLNLPSSVNAVLAGRTELPWGAWWRLRIFFLLVAIQRRFPIARPFAPSSV